MKRWTSMVAGLAWCWALAGALLAVSAASGKEHKEAGAPESGKTRTTAPTDSASVAAGAKLFASYCVPCHGKSGHGDGPVGVALKPPPRNFTHPQDFKSKTDAEVFKVISKGGAANKLNPAMPAWGGTLKTAQIWQLIAFVRSLAPPDTSAAN